MRTETISLRSYEEHILRITNKIIDKHFQNVHPIKIINLLAKENNTLLSEVLKTYRSYDDDVYLLEQIVKTVNQKVPSQMSVYNSWQTTDIKEDVLFQGYIFLFGYFQEEEDIKDILSEQIENMKTNSWNSRAKFIVIITYADSETQNNLAHNLLKLLWETSSIVDGLIIMPNMNSTQLTNSVNVLATPLNIYTMFPYDIDQQNKLVLLDQCLRNEKISCNFFPPKIPNNFMGFPIKIGTISLEPYVIVKHNYIRKSEATEFEMEGLIIHLVRIIGNKINVTLIFDQPYETLTEKSGADLFADLFTRKIDIIAGVLVDIAISRYFADLTVRFISESVKWMVPCPKPIPRVQRIVRIFGLTTWIVMAIILFLSSIIIWRQANKISNKTERAYKELTRSVVILWTVFIGVSVPQLPKSTEIRIFFMTFVIYSFSICTVFQAFFTTFLVEPGYGEIFHNINEVSEANITFGHTVFTPIIMAGLGYDKHQKFRHNCLCPSYRYCIENIILGENIAMIIPHYLALYFANEIGVSNDNEEVCFLDEILITTGLSVGVSKGSPLLSVFNKYLTRIMEGGILEECWSTIKHEVNLKANNSNSRHEEYFVFSMKHLNPIFVLLMMGCLLSTIIFIVELLSTKCNRKK
ncbi:hypothetical protein L9F63_012970 [Diploptera punctata]|uniref:Uncharacterized protein n=1 Tax=Diploptera punctata TaxID=6984 RepID=A0AAD8ACL3_DIPPU|nr:hypothetical protein L9F63_012970 [Diploptera punctata]